MAATASASEASESPIAWHALPPVEVAARLGVSLEGLTAEQAADRLERFGPNVVHRAQTESPFRILWRQINNPLILVLIGSAVLALAMGKPTDGAVVFGVVVINALIGFIQEFRAGKAVASLSAMVPEHCMVERQGQVVELLVEQLVPGDLVLLAAGDKVPADLRLLESRNLHANESSLTGESVPVAKRVDPVATDTDLGDRTCLAFGGTLITAGTGRGLVVATGAATELGRISALLHETPTLETPLTKSMETFGRIVALVILIVAAAILVVGLARGFSWIDALLAAITLAVAAIPEGLPAIITIALAIGVRRMAARRAIIRLLPAVETLGSTTVICSDKTGTLTKNEMTVVRLWTKGKVYRLTGVGYIPEGRLEREAGEPIEAEGLDQVRPLLWAGLLCNDASIQQSPSGDWQITGDPTEAALVAAARKIGLTETDSRRETPRLDAVPFESESKFMATLHAGPDGATEILLKGAPEVVLSRCEQGAAEGRAAADALAAEGLRVLAFARKRPETGQQTLVPNILESGFELLGLQGMIDPARPEALAAIRECQEAGIAVKMITGDHQGTAVAIARELGLLGEGRALTGRELAAMTSVSDLADAAAGTAVFARVAPEHKLRLVEALQSRGHVVAMTGDGVNDAPALKRSNIGVAMGKVGTAVAREAADVVLTDDNFASIVAAVEEGRHVYDNLIKALAFVLPTNLGEALVVLVAVMFFPFIDGEPLLPALPVQILWINLVATVALALPLAFEAREPNVMRRRPREPNEPLLSRFVVIRTVGVALLMTVGAVGLFLYEYFVVSRPGNSAEVALAEAQTMAVTTIVMFQIFYLLNCRSLKDAIWDVGWFSNWTIYAGIGLLLVLQIGFVHLPFMHRLFSSGPLDAWGWAKATLAGFLIVPVIAVEKWYRKRNEPE